MNACYRWFVLACCLPMSAGAQTLTLYDAVSKVIVNYPQIKQRQAEVAAGRAHITTVNGNKLPTLILMDQATLGTDNSMQGAYFSMGMVPSTPGNNLVVQNSPNMGNTAISFLKWDFLTFGYYNAQRQYANTQLAINEANLNSDKYLLTQNTVTLYLDWLKKYRLLRIQGENVSRAGVILSAIRATVLSGLKPGVDSSTASAAYSDARITYLKALDDYNYDRITLNTYTGIAGENIIPDTAIVSTDLLDGTIRMPLSDSVPSDHPLLDVYQKQYELQLANMNTISKKYLPHLGVDGATWMRSSGISPTGVYPANLDVGMPNTRYNYLLGLSLTYNIFDLKHRHDELAEGRYESSAMQSAVQTQQENLGRMMTQANSTYATTLEVLREIPRQLFAARQAYGQQVALYKSGLNTLIEVTNAQYALLQAETSYVNTQDELLQLLYIRAGLSGQSDLFLQNFKK